MATAPPDWDVASDAELARSAANGDRAAFGGIYDRYADHLHDFCVALIAERDAAADCVQEVFCTAAQQLSSLREPDKLRPWLYAMARTEAQRVLRQRRREDDCDDQSSDADPDTLSGRTKLARLVSEAARGLSARDCEVLELNYRHGLDGAELAEALDVTAANAAKTVSRVHETVDHALGALLVARRVHRNPKACPELGAVLADWDGEFNVLVRKRVGRHIDSCDICERSRHDLVDPKAMLGRAPLVTAPWWLRGQTLAVAQPDSAEASMDAWSAEETRYGSPTETLNRQPSDALGSHDGTPYLDEAEERPEADELLADELLRKRWIVPIAIFASVLIVTAAGGVYLWLHHHRPDVGPQQVIKTTPSAPPAPSSPPTPAQTEPSSPPPPAPAPPPTEPPPPSQTAPPVYTPTYTPKPSYAPTPRTATPQAPAPSAAPSVAPPPPSAPPGWPPGLPPPAPWTPPTFSLPTWTPPTFGPPQLPGNPPPPGAPHSGPP